MIDFGAWVDGKYSISEPLRPDHFAEFADINDLDPNEP